ncbi:MAG: prepilin peptidase, partial [Lachnospiraceae bacterium]|nr:prepilin peptidase [Lachnospiraceae bacterium]
FVAGIAHGPWYEYVIGFFAVSVPLLGIYYFSKGRGIGGGDVKLMAAAGLVLGWKLVLLALIAGCLYGSVIHIIRMKTQGEGSVLAMGPYFSAGILTAMWFGGPIIEWYSSFF